MALLADTTQMLLYLQNFIEIITQILEFISNNDEHIEDRDYDVIKFRTEYWLNYR